MKQGWELKKLGEVCDIIGGGTPSKSNMAFYTGNIAWATVRDMKNDYLEKTEFSISETAVKKSSTNVIPKNNVIIASRVGLGKVCIIQNDTAINQDLRGIIPTKNKIIVKFLFYWFKNISNYIIKNGKGATVHGVNLLFLRNLLIPIPPLSEQQRIVEILDEAFGKIDTVKQNAERNLNNSKELFQSVLRFEMQPQESWVEWKLGKLCKKITDGSHNPPKGVEHSEYIMLSSKNIIGGEITFDNPRYLKKEDYEIENNRTDLSENDVLLTIVGTIGRTAIVPNWKYKITLQRSVAVLKPNIDLIYSQFLQYLLNSIVLKLESESRGVAQKGIYLTQLKDISIYLPSLEEQQQIISKLDALSEKCKTLKNNYLQTIKDCDELKKAILTKAFNGEL